MGVSGSIYAQNAKSYPVTFVNNAFLYNMHKLIFCHCSLGICIFCQLHVLSHLKGTFH